MIAVPVSVFCEFVWVLRRSYARSVDDIAAAIQAITEVETVVTERPAVAAGLAALRSGADFADGAIQAQGAALGGQDFASFDRKAVSHLTAIGLSAADTADLIA